MRRSLSLLVVLILLCSFSSALSESSIDQTLYILSIKDHYSVFVDGTTASSGKGRLFDFDSLNIDLYLTNNENYCYLCITEISDGIITTTHLIRATIETLSDRMYLSYNNLYLVARRDENGSDIWIDYKGRSFRLRPSQPFSVYEDWKSSI